MQTLHMVSIHPNYFVLHYTILLTFVLMYHLIFQVYHLIEDDVVLIVACCGNRDAD